MTGLVFFTSAATIALKVGGAAGKGSEKPLGLIVGKYVCSESNL